MYTYADSGTILEYEDSTGKCKKRALHRKGYLENKNGS